MRKITPSLIVLTIGHSTRTLEDFIVLLQAHSATRVVDVRTMPQSRHNPQFNKASLPSSLKKAGLGYVHLPGLGWLRHTRRDSVISGWRNASFRGYADYMQTPEFEQSLDKLIQLADQEQIVLMCAEAVPWRCHRSLLGDALLIRGIPTEDIMSSTRRQVLTLTAFAKVRGTTITYPSEDEQCAQIESGECIPGYRDAPTPARSAESDLRGAAEPAIKRNPNVRSIPIEGRREERGESGKQEDATMHANPLKILGPFGQSLWLDYIQHDVITSGRLRRLIEEDGLRRMTSNFPSLRRRLSTAMSMATTFEL